MEVLWSRSRPGRSSSAPRQRGRPFLPTTVLYLISFMVLMAAKIGRGFLVATHAFVPGVWVHGGTIIRVYKLAKDGAFGRELRSRRWSPCKASSSAGTGPAYDEGLVQRPSGPTRVVEGDAIFNPKGMSEDIVAPWSVDGTEIELPDWRPQPNQEYRIVDLEVLNKLDKVYDMFGSQVKLVSTAEGIYRFIYWGNIRNLIGCEAWTKLILTEEVGLEDVKQVRFETNYVRDWPDDY